MTIALDCYTDDQNGTTLPDKTDNTTCDNDEYTAFLQNKVVIAEESGFNINIDRMNINNYDHQNVAIAWAARLGRCAIAASFGLGKTRIQCELARIIHEDTGKKFFQVCPLGVRHQFTLEDGPALQMDWQYVRTDEEIRKATSPYLITNYERVRDGNITPSLHDFGGCSLDEADVLRNLGSKTFDIFRKALKCIPFRFLATATPCPNELGELLQYAEYLGVMDRGQALTRFFKRDSTHAGHLTLHPLHAEEFWLWVSSWMLCYYLPSDMGFPDDGYILPELRVHWHRLDVDHTRAFAQHDNRGQHRLLLNAATGVTEACQEKRATLAERVVKMQEIMSDNPDDHFLLWHHLEDERRAIEKAVPGAVTVYGTQDLDLQERHVIDFTHGRIKILAGKPEMLGSGCNFQRHCHKAIYLGVDYKFKDFIQGIHRIMRFQQQHPVDIHIIYAESEDQIVTALQRKWQQHEEMVTRMRDIVQNYGLAHDAIKQTLTRRIGVERVEDQGKLYTAVHNDCVLETANMPDNSVDLILTSIPFGNHYEYTEQYEDFGHNPSDVDFWAQMDYLIPQLLRITKPGRVAAIHIKDRVLYQHQTAHGMPEIGPTSDECVMAFRKHGWLYGGRRTIITDVVRENNSTYRLGYTEMCKDASKMGSGLPEYMLLFRKPNTDHSTARADEPVTKEKSQYSLARWQIDAHSFYRSGGNRALLPHELYDYEEHVARLEAKERTGNLPKDHFYSPPRSWHPWVWDDINPMLCLNANQTQKKRENHICPLPFDIVERVIRLYSNEGDVVLDPFAGLFTVVERAVKLGRYGTGIELNRDYFADGVGYCRAMEQQKLSPTLFDYTELMKRQNITDINREVLNEVDQTGEDA